MAKHNQTRIDSKKREFLLELQALLKKYDVKIVGYGGGVEVEDGNIDIRFNDGSEITYTQTDPYKGVECIVDATRVFDFD